MRRQGAQRGHRLARRPAQHLFKLWCEGGFYGDNNIRNIAAKGQRFTIPVPSHLTWQKELIDKVRPSISRPAHIIRNPEDDTSYIYGITDYQVESYGRTWRHVYFDPVKNEQDVASLMLKLRQCDQGDQELICDARIEKHRL